MESSDQTLQSCRPTTLYDTPGRQFVRQAMFETAQRGDCPRGIPVVFLKIWREVGQDIDARVSEAAAEGANGRPPVLLAPPQNSWPMLP